MDINDNIKRTYLVILRRELVEALLDDVVPVEILDEHNDVQAQRQDDGVDLNIAKVSLLGPPVSSMRAN